MAFKAPDFLSATDPATLIVYGVARDASVVLSEITAQEHPAPLGVRHALVSFDIEDLRLSSPGWIDISPDERMELPSAPEQYLLCREKIGHGASNFSLPIRQFLNRYLDFCWAQVEAHQASLDPAPPETDLFTWRDWVFSAWLPMPHARVLLPPSFDEDSPAFAEIDIMFRCNGRLTAVMIEGLSTPLKSVRRRRDFLFAQHPALDVVSVPKENLTADGFPGDLFGAAFTRFWHGLTLPIGPCPPML